MEQAQFTPPDSSIYQSNTVYPSVPCGDVFTQRKQGYTILIITLFPVRYRALSGEITYYPEMKVEVETNFIEDAKSGLKGKNSRLAPRPELFEEMRALVDNPEVIESYQIDLESEGSKGSLDGILPQDIEMYQYVIITTNDLRDAGGQYTFHDLIEDKKSDGMTAKIVTVEDDIYPHYDGTRPDGEEDDQTRIRNFIKDYYENYGASYVLLGGDINHVPARFFWVESWSNGYRETMPVDMYYGCLDGTFDENANGKYGEPTDGEGGGEVDLFAEVYVGRASVTSAGETSNFVRKTLQYENAPGEYQKTVYMVGEHLGFGGQSEYAKESMEEIRLGSSIHGYTTVGFENSDFTDFFETEGLYDKDSTWSKSELIEIMDSGVHILNHLGHANYTYDMKLYTDELSALQNDDYFFAYSQGCLPGGFDKSDCFAEIITTMDKGAFAVVMNARYGWGTRGSTAGPSQYYDREFWDAFLGERKSSLGWMNQDSKEDNVARINGDCMRWCYYELNLFGDPETSIQTKGGSVYISLPLDGDLARESVTIFGSAFLEENFEKYELDYMPEDDPGDITVINSSLESVQDGELGVWDTNECSDGGYVINLTVTSTAGDEFVRSVHVIVDNEPDEGEETPWKTNENGDLIIDYEWNYTLGYRFTPVKSGQIIRLGGYFNGAKRVYLWDDSSPEKPLASTVVSTNNEWKYAFIDPIFVEAGHSYTVGAYLENSGGSARIMSAENFLPQTYGNITIEASCYVPGDAYPEYCMSYPMFGQVDIAFLVDTTPPETPMVTDDGEYTQSTDRLHAVWISSDPESGIVEYQYAIGISPGGTDVVGWTSAGIQSEVREENLQLMGGTTYYFSVKAKNGAGLESQPGYSDGITISTKPDKPIVTDDGDYTPSADTLHAAWRSSSDGFEIVEYQYAIGIHQGSDNVFPWTSAGTETEVTQEELTLIHGNIYYFSVKAKNEIGLWSEVGCSNGIEVRVEDATPPTEPIVDDFGDYTSSTDALYALWSSSDPETGIVEYQYAIGTSAGATDIVNWTSTGTGIYLPKIGFNLSEGMTYYISVKARNGVDLWSSVGCSNGITIKTHGAAGSQTPWKSFQNGIPYLDGYYDSTWGYKFTPKVDGQITQLGGLFQNVKKVSLWDDSSPGQPLTSATVNSNSAWNYTFIEPVNVVAGHSYTVAVYLGGSGGRRMCYVEQLPQTYGDITITSGCITDPIEAGDVYPGRCVNSIIYGEVDIGFVPDEPSSSQPTIPVVIDEGTYTISSTTLGASWSSTDPEGLDIIDYQYAIGTTQGATDVVGWTSVGVQTSVLQSDLSLSSGVVYYFSVKAKNEMGRWSEEGYSDGIIGVEYPWKENENGTLYTGRNWSFRMGYKFTPIKNGQIVKLGGFFNGAKTIHLWDDASRDDPLASAVLSSSNDWQYAFINPVNVFAEHTYVVAVDLAGSGGSYRSQIERLGTQAYGNIMIEATCYGSTGNYPTRCYDTVMYGQVDIGFVEGTPEDITPPARPIVTDDGETTFSIDTLHAEWSSSDSETGIVEYQYAIGTSQGDGNVVNWTSVGIDTEVTKTGLSLSVGTMYYFSVKARNGAALWSEEGYSNGIKVEEVDASPPRKPMVTDDGEETFSIDRLHASWYSVDPESGIAEYQYAIGTSQGGVNVVNWTSVGIDNEVTKKGLSLSPDTTYYFSVKAKNGVGLWSEKGYSNGITARKSTDNPQYPWSDNEYGELYTDLNWNYSMGYKFIPQVDGQITKLGGFFDGTKTVKLWDAVTQEELASVEVTSSNEWAYGPIAPVIVTADKPYVVGVFTDGSGASYRNLQGNILPKTFNDVRIVCGVYSPGNSFPSISHEYFVYGQADIGFVPDE